MYNEFIGQSVRALVVERGGDSPIWQCQGVLESVTENEVIMTNVVLNPLASMGLYKLQYNKIVFNKQFIVAIGI